MLSCATALPVLNGSGVRTEGSRLKTTFNTVSVGTKACCNPYPPSVQAPITPAESSRIQAMSTPSSSGMVSASRVQWLLARGTSNYRSEGVRIQQETQALLNCQAANPLAQFNSRTPPLPVCPPLPPPPGPPAPRCVLAKNQRLF